jgi:RND family efflux transporter MFP subunit
MLSNIGGICVSKRLSIVIPVASVAAVAMLTGCGKKEADPRTEPPLVKVSVPTASSGATREFTGVVAARVQSDLGFRVGGKVVERLVNTGQTVRRGQPLMRIDNTDLALATQAANGTVAAAEARAIQTAADERRYRDLVGAGAVSSSAYDQTRAAADSARGQLVTARSQARVARNETNYTVLLADADGTIVETLAEPGQVVTAGQIVVRIARAGAREALVQLPETLRPAIGSTAQARIYDGGTLPARLRQISDAADSASRTFEARYVLDRAGPPVPFGSTVTVAIATEGQVASTEVPLGALHDVGRGPGVWVIRDPKQPTVTWKSVELAAVGEETATIVSGLEPGQRFVAMGAHMLREGQRVRIAVPAPGATR